MRLHFKKRMGDRKSRLTCAPVGIGAGVDIPTERTGWGKWAEESLRNNNGTSKPEELA